MRNLAQIAAQAHALNQLVERGILKRGDVAFKFTVAEMQALALEAQLPNRAGLGDNAGGLMLGWPWIARDGL